MIRTVTALALIPLVAAPFAAGAQSTGGSDAPEPMTLTYEAFEIAVPHTDLETCPASLATEGVFCRATLNLEEIHVFAFLEAGEQPLVEVAHFPADGLTGILD